MKISEISDTVIKAEDYEITSENFENILNVYTDNDGYYFFNNLNTITFPKDLDPESYIIYYAEPDDLYTLISYKFYNTIKLWWVVCGANQIINPTSPPYVGRPLKILKPDYVATVLNTILGN